MARVEDFDLAAGDAHDGEELRGLATKNLVHKPGKIPTDPVAFDDWKFDMENFMTIVKAEYAEI